MEEKQLETNLWYYVNFEIIDTHTLDTVYALENELHEQGIFFDTGYAFLRQFGDGQKDVRDWQLDWSLRGGAAQDIIKLLAERDITYQLGIETPTSDWSYRPGHGWVSDEEG